jgi:plasmid stability protein
MGTVTIRNLDDVVIERAKQQARSNNRSLEAELRTIITHAFEPLSPETFFRAAREIRERNRGRPQTDSALLRHPGRDEA